MKKVCICNDQCQIRWTDGWLAVSLCGKNFNVVIFLDTINNDKCQARHDRSIHRALPTNATFSDPDCLSSSQQCQF